MSPRHFETVQDSDTEIIEQVTYRRRTKKGIKTTYKQVRSDQPPVEKSGQASNTRSRTQRQTKLRNEKQLEPHTAKATQPEEDNIGYMDTHEFIDEQEDNLNNISPEGMQTLPTISSALTASEQMCFASHYAPTSLYSLGYLLCLGHAGEPCPKTVEGVKASRKRRTRAAASSSLQSVEEEDGSLVDTADHICQLPTPRATPQPDGPTTAPAISNTLFDFLDTPMDSRRNGNPLITSIDRSGVFKMEVLFCACSDAYSKDEQLLRAGLFPSTFKQIENIFTFAVLDNFLTNNLECKTTAQQYYSKLQSMTSAMFPDHVPNRYKQLLRASRQWRDLKNRMQTGLGYQAEQETPQDGSMAIFCPACPQPGINLPDDWKMKYPHGAEMVQPSTCNTYKAIEQANSSRPHLDVTGVGATACHHGFFVPTSVVDFQKGERICKALSYNMEDIPVALVMYDINSPNLPHPPPSHPSSPFVFQVPMASLDKESGDSSVHGQTSWIACGLKIQEMQFTEDAPTLPLGDYSEFNHVDSVDGSGASHTTGPSSPTHCHTPRTSNGSGINNVNAEDISILLPSTLGWEWCVQHSVQSLAEKEARLQYAQATDSIHSMCLALGFKSALFRDQVQPANTQQTKT
ncbi:hypothetical protein BJY52DRAFT_1230144 [Lactarius psammicola]|nr:hypothetical protein BJY52DRAFT_1230144 [Lactarius psammicola]